MDNNLYHNPQNPCMVCLPTFAIQNSTIKCIPILWIRHGYIMESQGHPVGVWLNSLRTPIVWSFGPHVSLDPPLWLDLTCQRVYSNKFWTSAVESLFFATLTTRYTSGKLRFYNGNLDHLKMYFLHRDILTLPCLQEGKTCCSKILYRCNFQPNFVQQEKRTVQIKWVPGGL